jgi:hypothetical protein
MLTLVKMFRGMLVPGRITATNIAALHAEPKMDPRVPFFDALFADMCARRGDLDLVEM